MRIISRGKGYEPMRVTCDSCGSELEYLPDDIACGTHFCYVNCPVCGKDIFLDDKKEEHHIPVYPNDTEEDFFFYKDGVNISDEEINEWIRDICDRAENTPEDEIRRNGIAMIHATGNALVFAYGQPVDGEPLSIYVTKDFAEAEYFLKQGKEV